MSIKEKLENNIALIVLGSLCAGFGAGFGAFKAISDIKSNVSSPHQSVSSAPIDCEEVKNTAMSDCANKDNKIKELEGSLSSLKTTNLELQLKDLFPHHCKPYPILYNKVKIGDSINKLHDIYSISRFGNTDEFDTFEVISGNKGPFERVYYHKDYENKQTIDSIWFAIDWNYHAVILSKALETFGEPKKEIRKTEKRDLTNYEWTNINKCSVSLKLDANARTCSLHITRY